jgi:hypothetical protein
MVAWVARGATAWAGDKQAREAVSGRGAQRAQMAARCPLPRRAECGCSHV